MTHLPGLVVGFGLGILCHFLIGANATTTLDMPNEAGAGLLGAILSGLLLVASVAMWFLSCSSVRTGERNLHYVVPAAIGAIGLVVGGLKITSSPAVAMSGFTLGAVGCISTLPAFWAHAPYLLSGSDSVTGIAFITAVGNIAGCVSPYMVALIKGEGPGLGNASAAIIVTAGLSGRRRGADVRRRD